MIDPETGWSKITKYNNKQTDTITNLLYQMWLCRYPRRTIITYYCGNEFLGHEFKQMNQEIIRDKRQVCNYVKSPSELNIKNN